MYRFVILSEAKDLAVGRKPQDPSLHSVPLRTTTLNFVQAINRANPYHGTVEVVSWEPRSRIPRIFGRPVVHFP
jgi:hypothetical protein